MTPNLAASVHQRLLNRERATERPFNEVLQRFALERFLYRVGCSTYSRRFVLKGAMMLTAWQVPFARPARGIDLLGRMENSVEGVVAAVQAICQTPVPDDGLRFDAGSAVGERILEAADYSGVRVRFTAYLGNACIPMRIDVGFGDPLVPGPALVRLPTILDFPPPEVQGYSRESAIAEKYHAMVTLGQLNSRMKDFYDIWSLASHFAFECPILAEAISKTFQSRGVSLPLVPTAFTDESTGMLSTWQWSFGDREASAERNPTHKRLGWAIGPGAGDSWRVKACLAANTRCVAPKCGIRSGRGVQGAQPAMPNPASR